MIGINSTGADSQGDSLDRPRELQESISRSSFSKIKPFLGLIRRRNCYRLMLSAAIEGKPQPERASELLSPWGVIEGKRSSSQEPRRKYFVAQSSSKKSGRRRSISTGRIAQRAASQLAGREIIVPSQMTIQPIEDVHLPSFLCSRPHFHAIHRFTHNIERFQRE